ncbi:MAG TPA: MFS transporter [Dehalococcoidia bacterium]|nr:MFS transporter [Dehalococcoidia bacterium]
MSNVGNSRALSIMHERQFSLYWVWGLLSDFAQWAQLAVQAWLILELTGSPAYLGLFAACRFLPKVLLTPLAGVVADHVSRLRILRATQTAMLIISLALAFVFSGAGAIWTLLALNVLLGAVSAFEQPASRALLPNLVEPKNLLYAVSLHNSAGSIGVIAGPVTAAFLLGATNGAGALYVSAGLFMLPLLPLMKMAGEADRSEVVGKLSVGENFKEGLHYLYSTPLVAGLLLVSLFPGILDRMFIMYLPLLTHHATSMASCGGQWMPIVRGVGALTGALAIAALGPMRITGKGVMITGFACTVSSALFIFMPFLILALAILAIAGVLRAVLATLTTTMLHSVVPDGVRGRVMAI